MLAHLFLFYRRRSGSGSAHDKTDIFTTTQTGKFSFAILMDCWDETFFFLFSPHSFELEGFFGTFFARTHIISSTSKHIPPKYVCQRKTAIYFIGNVFMFLDLHIFHFSAIFALDSYLVYDLLVSVG